MKRALIAAMSVLLGGCWVLLGESFTGYTTGPAGDGGSSDAPPADGSVPVDAADAADAADADAGPHPIDDCTPAFVVANGVVYPDHAPGPREIADVDGGVLFDTDKDCLTNDQPYCLVLASTFSVAENGNFLVFGSKPLVVVAVHDLTIAASGIINVAGSESGTIPGPGDHNKGSAASRGGGGGNAEPGGASSCGDNGGATIDVSLVGGGHGGGILPPAPQSYCRQGGAGGGALELVSLCGTITIKGTINASGGGGGTQDDPACPEGAGGGAGGTVWIQSSKAVVFDNTSASIQLEGGGGGGGDCRDAVGDMWRAGNGGLRQDPGPGATCDGGAQGGDGGAGGANQNPPGRGGAPVPGGGEAKCGGGGGARGRLVLQGGARCAGAPHTGVCAELP